ncbi:MAG: calcium/sodium antiporter [Acidimicrobiales bacterium]
MTATFTFLGGLALLLLAGSVVVSSASAIGRHFGLTPMVVGLTIVAAGTSAPELAVVGQSVAAGDTELAVGSVIGSNIANVLLVLGLAAACGAVKVANRVVRVDIPVMIGASAALLWMAQDQQLSRFEGIAMLLALVIFVAWTLRASKGAELDVLANASTDAADRPEGRSTRVSIMLLALGVVGLAVAARFVVQGAEQIAASLGIPELIIGLTIVAIGTSAPEITTTVIAALNGQRELAVGNAVGSNIFNILLVFGASTTFSSGGIAIGIDAVQLDLPIMLAAAFACLPMVVFDNKLDRWEGAVFVAYYLAYVLFLVLDATGHRAKDPFVFVMIAFVGPLTIFTVATITVRQRRRAQASGTRNTGKAISR